MKSAICWDVTPHRIAKFQENVLLQCHGRRVSQASNIGTFRPHYTAPHPRMCYFPNFKLMFVQSNKYIGPIRTVCLEILS
jgi:hypothetical protein